MSPDGGDHWDDCRHERNRNNPYAVNHINYGICVRNDIPEYSLDDPPWDTTRQLVFICKCELCSAEVVSDYFEIHSLVCSGIILDSSNCLSAAVTATAKALQT